MTKHKGLTRTITRKQARSYDRLTPNGLGVTAIASVNGRGARKRARALAAATIAAARVTRSVKRHGTKSAHTKRAKRLARAAGYSGNLTPREALTQARIHATTASSRSKRTAAKLRGRKVAAPNPKRPAKGWFKKCVVGVKRTGRAIDPRAVCGATWSRKTAGQKRTALAAYETNAKRSKSMRRKKPSKAEYARRYKRTQAILQRPRASRKRIHGIPPLFVGGGFPVVVPPAPRRRRRARPATETGMARKRKGRKKARTPAQRAAFKRMIAGLARYKKKHGGGRRRKKKAHAPRKAARRPKRRRYTSNRKRRSTKRAGRAFGGFHSVSATVGGRKLPTYLYRTKRGKLKKIPVYAIAGAKSKAQVRSIMSKGGKRAEAYRRRMAAIHRQRTRAGRRVSEHGDIFTPNRGIVVPYQTWSASMTPNRKRKSKSRRGGKSRSRSAAARKAARTRAMKHEKRSRAAKKAARTRRKRRGGYRKNAKAAAPMVANRRRRKSHGRRKARKHVANRRHRRGVRYTDNRRRSHRRRKSYAKNRKHVRHYGKNRKHVANRRRRSYLPVRVARISYASNRRRHRRHGYKANRRRHYSQNPFSGRDFMARLKGALKVGALVAVGFAAHRAITKIVSDQLLGQVSMFQSGPMLTYRGLISGLLVGGIALYTTDKLFKKNAGEVNSGIFASLVHSVLTTGLTAMGQPSIAAALSAYPDAEGRAYHGFGEYVPVSGFGAYEMVSGLGATSMLSQAAAGFGDIPTRARYGRSSSIAQAAAGFGAPMLSQAAAGVGEYIAQGVEGIGDYEMVSGVGVSGFGAAMDDGIRPDLHSAERALNIAEAAAGLGDIGTQSTLNPMMIAQPISDAPEGMRAGILQGGDGIFG